MIKFLRRDEGPLDPADQPGSRDNGSRDNGSRDNGSQANDLRAIDSRVQDKPDSAEGAAFGPPKRDDGLGVPPFHPASSNPPAADQRFQNQPMPNSQTAPGTQSLASRDLRQTQDKETSMARSPFSSSGQQNPTPMSTTPASPMPGGAFRPNVPRAPETAERRTLVVGRGISLQGVVQDAERLVVEGTVEATMIHATELAIAQGGVFKGEVEVEEAEIAGTIDGTLTARHALIVRATGRVLGTARCKRLQVEDGGQITGRIEMLTENGGRPADQSFTT